MSQRHPLAIVAGAATLLAAFPLTTVFSSFTWLFYTAIAVIAVVGTAMLVRTARGPVWAQVLAMMATLLLYLTFVFPSGEEFGRLIPTVATFQHFNDLLVAAGLQIREEAVPVPDLEGLLLLTTAGVGLVAVLVDLAAVGIRRPALAGLPMLAIYSVPVAVLPDGLSVLPFGFAAAGYLWLLVSDSVDRVRRFGRRFTGDGRDIDLWEPSPLSSAGRRLGVVGVAIAMLLPLAVPGMTSGLIDRFGSGLGPGDGTGAGSGAAASVNLTALLKDNLERKEPFDMVKMTTTDPSPFYLRFGVADQITKDGFANQAPAGGAAVTRGFDEVIPPSVADVTSQRFRAQVEAVNFSMNLAPLFPRVASTEGLDASWLYDGSTEQIYTRRSGGTITGKVYSFEYVRMSYTPAALRKAGPIPGTDNAARQMATVPQVPQVTELVTTLTTGKITEYDKVRAIYDHFTSAGSGFTYSLTTEAGTSGNAIVDFLTSKKGFCVQYAAAMAWLVRAAGFPARVAFGFTRGAGPSNGLYTLTNFNLHAWTEVFFPDFGWIPFDPTPAGSVPGSVQTSWAPDPSDPSTGLDQPELVPGQETEGVETSTSPGAVDDPIGDENPGAGAAPINTWWLIGAAGVVVALFLLFAPALRRRALRRRRRSTSGPVIVLQRSGETSPATPLREVLDPSAVAGARRDAHEAWAELLDTMVDFRVVVDEAETPRATADRIGQLPDIDAGARTHAELLAQVEERARYARSPIRADGINDAVRAIRAALIRRATRWERLGAALMPQSVVQRWRTAWVMWLSGSIRATGRLRDAMLWASPRRLLARSAPR